MKMLCLTPPHQNYIRFAEGTVTMPKLSAAFLVLAPLALAACSTLSVESEARHPEGVRALTRTLVVVALSDASRGVAEETLVAHLTSLHPATWYETVALVGGVTLGTLRERARKDGFDGLLVVWLDGVTQKQYPDLAGEGEMGIPGSSQIRTRPVASLTALDGDLEIWKGIVTSRDAGPGNLLGPHLARETVLAFADRLHKDGVAN